MTRLQMSLAAFRAASLELEHLRSRRSKHKPKLTVLVRYPHARKPHAYTIHTDEDLPEIQTTTLRFVEGLTTRPPDRKQKSS